MFTGAGEDDLRSIEKSYLERGKFLVGVLDGSIVAMGAIRPSEAKGVAELRRMRVDKNHRRKGYGQSILSKLEDRAHEIGYRAIILDVGVPQIPAQKLYEKNNYIETHRNSIEGIPVIWYRKEL